MRPRILRWLFEQLAIKTTLGLVLSLGASLFFIHESELLDWRFQLRDIFQGPHTTSDKLYVITLDENFALSRNYPEVVPRDYLARIIDTLSTYGARVIALDYEIRAADRTNANYDTLCNAVWKARNVVLPTLLDPTKGRNYQLDVPPYELRVSSLTGYAELESKRPQEMILSYQLIAPLMADTLIVPSFALAATAAYIDSQKFFERILEEKPSKFHAQGRDPFLDERTFGPPDWLVVLDSLDFPMKLDGVDFVMKRSISYPINYAGPVYRNFTNFSSEDFLRYSIFKEKIAGKLVLVGSIYSSKDTDCLDCSKDEFSTPFGTLQGVEVHANIINNLLTKNYLIDLGNKWEVALSVLALTFAVLCIWRLSLTKATIWLGTCLLGYVILGFILFIARDLILPLACPIKFGLGGLVLGFLVFHSIEENRKTREYLDFEVLIQNTQKARRYKLHLIQAPAQAGDAKVEIDFAPETEMAEELTRLRNRDVGIDFIMAFGEKLFRRIFVDQLANSYHRSLTQIRHEKKRLRMRLRFDAPDLSTVPWEYLYDQSSRYFLSANPEVLLTRYIESELPRRGMAVDELNVLIVISDPSPESMKKLNLAELDAESEKELITNELARLKDKTDISIRHRVLNHAIPMDIQDELDKGVEVLHFIGHSTFMEGKGYVVLENEKHEAVLLSDEDFSELFVGRNELRLVVMNSCKSAATTALPELSGLAYEIIGRGVPAVVGMQYSVADETAIMFAKEFYRTLANSYPVDAAMARTRSEIFREFKDLYPSDFGIPVLFMRSRDGRII